MSFKVIFGFLILLYINCRIQNPKDVTCNYIITGNMEVYGTIRVFNPLKVVVMFVKLLKQTKYLCKKIVLFINMLPKYIFK